jgi:hypothetical protein
MNCSVLFLFRVPERCELQHRCTKLCWEDCGDCLTSVQRTLPCGHSLELYCYTDPEKHECPIEVEVELPHCGHKVTKPCHMDVRLVKCTYPCEAYLPCGHSCMLNCHKMDDPACGHLVEVPCYMQNQSELQVYLCRLFCVLICLLFISNKVKFF